MCYLAFSKLQTFYFFIEFFFSRTVLLTSWIQIQRLKSHFREPWGLMVMLSVIGGFSSSMETNAVGQWRLRLLFTMTGHLGTLICSIIGHLRGTVKISRKGLSEWNYGQDSVAAKPWEMLTLGGIQFPG